MGQFTKLTVHNLHPMTVVAQSLDNQWVPPALLRWTPDLSLDWWIAEGRITAAVTIAAVTIAAVTIAAVTIAAVTVARARGLLPPGTAQR